LKEKFFTRCELQGTICKFLEKMREDGRDRNMARPALDEEFPIRTLSIV